MGEAGLGFVLPVPKQGDGEVFHRMAQSPQPAPQVDILRAIERDSIAPGGLDTGGSQQHGGMAMGATDFQIGGAILGAEGQA
jgi:hypothetical protein